jgi:uncharacterized protein with NRDE domain
MVKTTNQVDIVVNVVDNILVNNIVVTSGKYGTRKSVVAVVTSVFTRGGSFHSYVNVYQRWIFP